jgi:hypothetical protein
VTFHLREDPFVPPVRGNASLHSCHCLLRTYLMRPAA